MKIMRIGQVWLEGRRAAMDAAMFRQEFMGEFVDDGGEVFDRGVVEAALDEFEKGLGVRLRFVR